MTLLAFMTISGPYLNHNSRLLSIYNIKTVSLPLQKDASFLRPKKDGFGLKTPDVYSIPCTCVEVYIRQTGNYIETNMKDQQWHIRLHHPDKSVVAKHNINLSHRIQFHNTHILEKKFKYMERVIKFLSVYVVESSHSYLE